MNKLSIIIVNWNTRDLLLDCLRSVFQHPPTASFEVWVTDNASKDGSAAAVRQAFPQVRLIESNENLGFARGNNIAIERCDGESVLLLNSDTVVRPGALDGLVQFMEAHPRVGAAGPYLLNPDESLQISCYPFPNLRREFWRMFHLDQLRPYGVYAMQDWAADQPRPVDSIQGACLILRRETLNQVGLLDPGYFMYTEEIDLCYRIHQAGWDLFWVPQARVVHYGGQSTRLAAQKMFLSLYRTKIQFFRKHYGPLSALIYKLILLLASLFRLLVSPLAWLHRDSRRERELHLTRCYLSLIGGLGRM